MGAIETSRNPGPRQLRQFAGLGLPLFCGVLGAVLYWKVSAPAAAIAVWAGGIVLSLAGLIVPCVVKPLFVGVVYATFPLGWLLTHVAMALLYYLVFTPVGLWLRLMKGDPMARRFDKTAKTYWKARKQPASIEQYFKEY